MDWFVSLFCSWDIGGGEQFCDISGKKVNKKKSHGVNGFMKCDMCTTFLKDFCCTLQNLSGCTIGTLPGIMAMLGPCDYTRRARKLLLTYSVSQALIADNKMRK